MGIPHLTANLRPFATPVDLAGHSAVIDGPGLAYHIWYVCLASNGEARNPFEAMPSYRFLGETVTRWLDAVQAHNVCLKKIYFDGLLPGSKRPTRIGRITGYTKQLKDYHQAWPQIIPSSYADSSSQSSEMRLFNVPVPASSFTKLPAAPFLVPAIVEALSGCERYAGLVEVVPGEADLYCAEFVRTHRGVIFTGDSDLLLYDLGDGAVCFFKDIDLTTSTFNTSLTCIRYQVEAIVRRLGLEQTNGLLALGFEMVMDAHASFPELLQRAIKLTAVTTYRPIYQDFASEYKAPQGKLKSQDTCNIGNSMHRSSLSRKLQTIDPRISEYLLQFSKISQIPRLHTSFHSRSIGFQNHVDVFLPFLLDCPLRTSAWEMSTSVRQLAYGLVNLVLPPKESILRVTEYRRLQTGSRGREWLVPTVQDLPNACVNLLQLFEKMQIGTSAHPEQSIWRALAIYQDQQLHLGTNKAALSSILIEQSKGRKKSPRGLTWDIIHLYAQFQGSYYSFRILKQILSITLLYLEDIPVALAFRQLHLALRSLSTLDELPTVMDVLRGVGHSNDLIILKMVQEHLDIRPMAALIDVRITQKKKKRRSGNVPEIPTRAEKARRQGGRGSRGRVKSPEESDYQWKENNNMFEVLSSG